MTPTVYVITYHDFNHGHLRPGPPRPLDARFLNSQNHYVYYLIDQSVPPPLRDKKTLLECEIDPLLHTAGGKFFGEWSFLLAEEKHRFCTYPLFMISSRFYEKNSWLMRDLNQEWNTLFQYLGQYGFGFLPSYDRPIRWIDLSWEKKIRSKAWTYQFFPFTPQTYQLVEDIFGTRIPSDYRYTVDLFCNYIGFQSRQDLLDYVQFYRPLIDYFFDAEYRLKRDLTPYIRNSGAFRNEKSFTFITEMLSHFFFFKKQKEFFALHYDGYYAINEAKRSMEKLASIHVPLYRRVKRLMRWQARKMKTEGWLAPVRAQLRKWI